MIASLGSKYNVDLLILLIWHHDYLFFILMPSFLSKVSFNKGNTDLVHNECPTVFSFLSFQLLMLNFCTFVFVIFGLLIIPLSLCFYLSHLISKNS